MLLRRHRKEADPVVQVEVQVETSPEGGSAFDQMTVEELRSYAEEKGIDLGRSTSHDGILKKILEAETEKSE